MVYKHLFFDVCDQLDNEVYIRKVAIGLSLHPSSAQIDPDVARGCLLRAVGYYGGPNALAPFVLGFSPGTPPQTPEELEKWLDASVRSAVTTRAWSAAFSSPVAAADRPELIKLALRSSAKVKTEPAPEKDLQCGQAVGSRRCSGLRKATASVRRARSRQPSARLSIRLLHCIAERCRTFIAKCQAHCGSGNSFDPIFRMAAEPINDRRGQPVREHLNIAWSFSRHRSQPFIAAHVIMNAKRRGICKTNTVMT